MTNRPLKQITPSQLHPGLQFFTFLVVFAVIWLMGNIIAAGVVWVEFGGDTFKDIANLNISTPREVNAVWVLQLISTTLPILIAPAFFSYVIVREPDEYLKTTFHFPWLLLVIVFVVMMIASPLIEWLSNINQGVVFPEALKGLEKIVRNSEDSAQKLSDAMLQMKTLGSLVFNLLVIGLLTAIVEEFMFRGCMQTILVRWTKNYHVAIWITAILFSAFHMEFYGFLPRLLLGVLFGYFVAWSGSIWTSVWAHFVNNGTAVIITYLFQHKLVKVNPDDQHVFNSAGYVISLIITLFLLFVYQYVSKRNNAGLAGDGEELD